MPAPEKTDFLLTKHFIKSSKLFPSRHYPLKIIRLCKSRCLPVSKCRTNGQFMKLINLAYKITQVFLSVKRFFAFFKFFPGIRRAGGTNIVLLPRKHQFKIGDKCVDHGDHAPPLGTWMQSVAASGGHCNCARDWRGAKRPRKRRNPRHA
jgi:hypothetical protein